jgi:predicted Zn-dependent protease
MNSDLKMNLNNIEYLIKNGEENFANKKYPEAIAAFFAVKLLDPNNEKVDYILGESYYFINQPKKAEPILIRILKKYPDNFDLRSHLAKVLELNKKWRLAAKEHEKLLENENENLEIIDKLIFFYENNK